jgi:DNA polymerase delta subunit 1
MIAHNICYSTLIKEGDEGKYDKSEMDESPTHSFFIKKSRCEGILPFILTGLLKERRLTRKAMGKLNIKDVMYLILNGRQLALKVLANSIYGITGASRGLIYCIKIAQSVTSYGRGMIQLCADTLDGSDYTVIYGDTDSVMIEGKMNKEISFKEGDALSYKLTRLFTHPIKLEFEKIYSPFLLYTKKRYTGLMYIGLKKDPKIDYKGIVPVRRDNCKFVQELNKSVIELLMKDKELTRSTELIKKSLDDLVNRRVDMSKLIISKSIAPSYKSDNLPPHVQLAEKINKRTNEEYRPGDRIPYVIIINDDNKKKNKNEKMCIEDPLYAHLNRCEINYKYYVEHQIKPSITQIYRLVEGLTDRQIDNKLFRVDYPRMNGRIEMFFNTVKKCPCGKGCSFNNSSLCLTCHSPHPNMNSITRGNTLALLHTNLSNQTNLINQLNNDRLNMINRCKGCHGDHYNKVVCCNWECDIYFKRNAVDSEIDTIRCKIDNIKLDIECLGNMII